MFSCCLPCHYLTFFFLLLKTFFVPDLETLSLSIPGFHTFHSFDKFRAIDTDRLSLDKCIRYLLVCPINDVAEGRTGDPHLSGSRLLVFPIKVRKSDGLDLVHFKHDLGRSRFRELLRPEITSLQI
jgi:hypothetical protein